MYKASPGVLLVVKNYTGDRFVIKVMIYNVKHQIKFVSLCRVNFTIAAEKARAEVIAKFQTFFF